MIDVYDNKQLIKVHCSLFAKTIIKKNSNNRAIILRTKVTNVTVAAKIVKNLPQPDIMVLFMFPRSYGDKIFIIL